MNVWLRNKDLAEFVTAQAHTVISLVGMMSDLADGQLDPAVRSAHRETLRAQRVMRACCHYQPTSPLMT